MKTPSFTVLLLLLTVYCTAMPRGLNNVIPGSCCFKFFLQRIPKTHIISITETHSKCSQKGFVVTTPKRQICVKHTEKWAKSAFSKQQVS